MRNRALFIFAIALTFLITAQAFADIVVYGDTQANLYDPPYARAYQIHRLIMSTVFQTAPAPSAFFHCGDMVNNGSDARDWQYFGSIAGPLISQGIFYPAIGNHEIGRDYGAGISRYYIPIFWNLPNAPNNNFKRWYCVDIEGIRFIVLDTNLFEGLNPDQIRQTPQYQWLERNLRETRYDIDNGRTNVRFIVMVHHHPLFTSGGHAKDPLTVYLRSTLAPLYGSYGVSIVFSGHDHQYERSVYKYKSYSTSNNLSKPLTRSTAVTYIVTGGGGAAFQDISFPEVNAYYSLVRSVCNHFCRIRVVPGAIPKLQVQAIEPVTASFSRVIDEFTVASR